MDSVNGTAVFAHVASGGDYDGAQAVELTAVEADDDERGFEFTAASLTVPEGGSIVYGVRLESAPSGVLHLDVSRQAGGDADLSVQPEGGVFDMARLTFDADNWNIFQSLTVLAAEDADAAAGVAAIAHVGTGSDYAGLQASLLATEADNDAALVLSTSMVTVPEGANASYGVRLAAKPGASVTVSATIQAIDAHDADLTVSGGSSLTFTAEDWSSWQTVDLAAAEDDDSINGTLTVTHAASGGDYDTAAPQELTAMEIDNDERGYAFTTSSLMVPEGGSAVYGVRLLSAPTGVLYLDVSRASGSDPDLSVHSETARLTFDNTNWNVDQSVTVLAAQDVDAASDSGEILHAGIGSDYAGIQEVLIATEVDDDAAMVLSTSSVIVPEGAAKTYGVKLAAQPGSEVTVAASIENTSAQDSSLTISDGSSLTFTIDDWSSWQTVTVAAAEDNDSFNGTAVISHVASGSDYDIMESAGEFGDEGLGNAETFDLVATEIDNDERGYAFTTSSLTVPEGGSAVYGVRLLSAPTGVLYLDVSPASGSDPDLSVHSDAARLTFDNTNWNVDQSVTVLAAQDGDAAAGFCHHHTCWRRVRLCRSRRQPDYQRGG